MKTLKDADSASDCDSVRNTIKYGTKFQALKGIFIEYFEESSIHGFRYIGEQKRPALDRIFWLLAVILSISTCCYLLCNIWEKHTNKSFILTFDENLTNVWEIPFPLITICPATKTHTNIFNYTKILNKLSNGENITKEEDYYFEAISQTCAPSNVPLNYGKDLTNASDLIQALLKTAPTLKEAITLCRWRDSEIRCEKIFDTILTEEGIYELEWDLENGYYKYLVKFPYRVVSAGNEESLSIILEDKIDDEDKKCRHSPYQGFKLILQTPGEESQVANKFINIPLDKEMSFIIKPKIMTTSEELRNYSPE
ncbi:pickpocket protein 28-like [Episyrphus balteatus]|uniref:pickpocket protein 28-like n=1 Tax=Episyrphus balteatus TaxID=286459 RepID=UPI00248630B8|nr:pickpocket protein 28-like [Episyrphus balteatus]